MKSRHFTAIALSILSLCVLPSCDKSVAVTGIKLDKTSLSLTEGESANLTATIEPSNATNGTVTWSSTDATIASVNNGLVKALTAGSTTVKVTTADGAKTAECAVTVNKKIIAVTGVILDFVSDTLIVNQTKQLTAIVKPDDASDKTVAWSSSNDKIASVDATGKVTAVAAGAVTITAKTNGLDASGKSVLATCDITVTQPVSGVTLDKTTLMIVEGDTATLTATVSPDDASDKTVTWSSSDAKVATVENGKVTAVKEGSAKITVMTKDGGKTAECAVTVSKKVIAVTGISLDATSATLLAGQTKQLTATVTPDDASDKTVSWSSSNEKIATVDATGKVTAVAGGAATITAKTNGLNAKGESELATCDITVSQPVTGVKLDQGSVILTLGESAVLTATVLPADATDKAVTWSTTAADIVSVDQSGHIKSIALGVATITVTTRDGEKTALCAVSVIQHVTEVSLDKTTADMVVGQTLQLTATVKPDDATDKTVTWSTSDAAIATVENGKVTAVKEGSAKITVTTKDGGKTAECAVTVSKKVIAVTGVSLDASSASMIVGQTKQLTATVKPDDATDKTVSWNSSNEKIASVDATGKVTAVAAGSATITVVTNGMNASGQSEMTTCDVTVTQPVSGVTLDKTTLTITEGETATLTATVKPDDASDKTVTWSSSDAKIATVDNGKVTAVKEGSAKITVTTKDGGKTAECAITVSKKIIAVTGVTLDKTTANMIVGQTKQLTATVKPDDATDKTVSWNSSNEKIASVDATGKVTAVAAGSATITVVTNGMNASGQSEMTTCDVTVTQPVSGVTLDKTTLTITEGETATLTATVKPDDASDKTVTWSSSDAKIATVDNGKVTAVKEGSAKITVTTKDGGKTAECAITVSKKIIAVTGVTLDKTTANMIVGQTKQLTATVKPDDATDKTVSWSSSNEKIASVDATGKVTAVAGGAATITAKTNGLDASGKSVLATCDVTVTQPVSRVTLDKTTLTLTEGDTATLTATVSPADATDKTVTWSTSDAAIATVDNGKVTAVKEGSAKITVTTKDGGKTAECTVTVNKKIIAVTGVTLDKTTANMIVGQTQQLTATVTPADATDKTVSWSSSNEKIASVDATGKVTAVAAGAVTITAKTNGLNVKWESELATCDITVSQPVTGVKLDQGSVTLTLGESAVLTATVLPADATDKAVTWSTTAAGIVSVDQSGHIKGIALGIATITVTTHDGAKTALCAVSVIQHVTEVSLDKTTADMVEGQTLQLTATVKPDDATDKTVSWSSSNASVAGVDADGLVSAKTVGSATITVTTTDGGKMATCDVTVKEMNIDIPDANFKAYLVQNFDTDGNGEISLSEAAAVTTITCGKRSIASMEGIQYFTALTILWCYSNQLTSLDLSKNTALTYLFCDNNQLTSLDVSTNTALTFLGCLDNHFTKLDVSKNIALTELRCGNNELTSLDVSKNTLLQNLYCCGSQLTSLNVSNNIALANLDCRINHLASLDLSNNTALQFATVGNQTDASGNAQWILVKRGSLADSVFPTLGDTGGFNYMVSFVISIPDANFKAYLVHNFDTNGDGEISEQEVAAVTTIECSGKSIASLEGIQYFTALKELYCYDNQLTSLDVSKNTSLIKLHCYNNQLTSLNVSANTALTNLHCSSNHLKSLDLSKNTSLQNLLCFSNHLASLDLSNNAALQYAFVGKQTDASGNLQWILVKRGSLANSVFPGLGAASGLNSMVSFVISIPDATFKAYLVQNFDTNGDGEISTAEAAAVTEIYCGDKSISSLAGIQYFTALTVLYCYANQLTSLDVSNNTALVTLSCHQNKLTSLNISANTALTSLSCYGNQLSSLDASTMAGSSFELGCGRQTDALGADKVLALVLSTSQKTRWETLIADSFGAYFNANVSVTYK
jgi:uncharacterized protein YjdB